MFALGRIPIQSTDVGRLFGRKVITGAPAEALVRRGMRRDANDGVRSADTVAFVSVTDGIGGPTRSLITLLEALGDGVERALVAPRGSFVTMLMEREAVESYRVMPKWRRLARLSRIVAAIDFVLWAALRRGRLLCIHANGHAELNVVGPASWILRIPVVMWAHAHEPSPSTSALAPVWRRLLHHLVIVAVSEDARAVVIGTGLSETSKSVRIIPNPIGDDVLAASRKDRDRDDIAVGFLRGRSAASGFTLIPAVVEELREEPILWLLFTAPPKPDAREDEAAAWTRLEPHVGTRVEMCGRIPAVDEAYARCEIVFCPSTKESFGRVAAESMLNGIPVVATDIPPFRRLIGDGESGLLFPVGDAKGAAECIMRLAVDPELRDRLGAEGRKRAQAFAPSRVAGEFLDVYRRSRAGDRARETGPAMPGITAGWER